MLVAERTGVSGRISMIFLLLFMLSFGFPDGFDSVHARGHGPRSMNSQNAPAPVSATAETPKESEADPSAIPTDLKELAAVPGAFHPPEGGSACRPLEIPEEKKNLPKPLGRRLESKRAAKLITDFSLDRVAPNPSHVGRGGILSKDAQNFWKTLGICGDTPEGKGFAEPGRELLDSEQNLRAIVDKILPAENSKRGWPSIRCGYVIQDMDNPGLYAELPVDALPACNEITGLLRDGNVVYATVQYNGYASEIGFKGNRIVALDLCGHGILWQSADILSNMPMILYRDYILTGYGFTKEPDFITVLNRWTGKDIQKVRLPKSLSDLRIQDGRLYVRIYDGYVIHALTTETGGDAPAPKAAKPDRGKLREERRKKRKAVRKERKRSPQKRKTREKRRRDERRRKR